MPQPAARHAINRYGAAPVYGAAEVPKSGGAGSTAADYMEGFVAIVGFWTFAILCVLRFTGGLRPRRRAIEANESEIQLLKSRVASLESQLGSMQQTLLEVKDANDFTHKLLTEKEGTATKAARAPGP